MRTLSRKILSLSLVAIVSLFFICFVTVNSSYADDDACSVAGINDPLICGTAHSDEEVELMDRTKGVLDTVYLWIGIIAVIFIVIGGIKYMTSQGEAEQIKRAKSTITFSIIGLVVTLAAFAITNFFIDALNGRAPSDTVAEGGGDGRGGSTRDDESRYKVKSISAIDSAKLMAGAKTTIKYKVVPDYATNRSVTFSSSDENVATVDQSGVVTAKKAGTTTITLSSSDGPKKEVKVTVFDPIPVTSIELSTKEVKLKKQKTATVTAKALPENATDKKLVWSSENTSVATVTQNGLITGIKPGNTTNIVVTARNQRVFAFNKNPSQITLADTNVPDEFPKVQAKVKVSVVGEYKAVDKLYEGNSMDHWLWVPEGATDNMPLVVILHGDGETRYPNRVLNYPQLKYVKKSKKAIALAPVMMHTSAKWENGYYIGVKSIIDDLIKKYKIDTKRIYIIGYSRGAIGSWFMVNKYPGFFAALMPISCGAYNGENPKNFVPTAVRGYVGNRGDDANYMSHMQSMARKIVGEGGKAEIIVLNGKDHGSAIGAIDNKDAIGKWLYSQRLKK